MTPAQPFHRQFLQVFLLIAIGGVVLNISLRHIVFRTEPLLFFVNYGLLTSLVVGYILSRFFQQDILAVFVTTSVILVLMVRWFFSSQGYLAGVTITIITVMGYLYSMILPTSTRYIMHAVVLSLLVFLLVYQVQYPERFRYVTQPDVHHILATGLPYIVIYFLVNLSFSLLKDKYTRALDELALKNFEINQMNQQIASQNTELSHLNAQLKELVEFKTLMLDRRNDQLEKYSFKNAHHVRGSLARIQGLLYLRKEQGELTEQEFLHLVHIETLEMDAILKQINLDLHD